MPMLALSVADMLSGYAALRKSMLLMMLPRHARCC